MSIVENIVPGKVLYLNVCFPHEEEYHDKYLVVVGVDTHPLLLKINSRNLKPSEFCLKQSLYPSFLTCDSYLDCGTVWYTLIMMDEVIKQISENPKRRVVGDILDVHKNEIIRRISQSKLISTKHKRIIAESLK
jgi:hypothetical protein